METKAQKISLCLVALLWAFTGHAQRWERVPDFEMTRRMGAISFSWKGKGYVGFGHDYNTRYPFNDLSSYDPATGQWQEITWLDGGFRTGAFCFLLGDEVYIGGGTRDSGKTALQDFHKYNLLQKQWTRLNALPFNSAHGAKAVVGGGQAYLLGGGITNGCETKAWQYNQASDTWRAIDTLPAQSIYPIAFVLRDEIYFGLGNGGPSGALAQLWKKRVGVMGWEPVRSFTESGLTMATAIAIDSNRAIAGLGFRIEDYQRQPLSGTILNGFLVSTDRRPESDYMIPGFWLYNAALQKWKRLPSQKLGRRGAISFIAGGYLYVGMGNAANKITKDVYRLNLSKL